MNIQILKDGNVVKVAAERNFVAHDEVFGKESTQTEYEATVTMSREQAEALKNWLTQTLAGKKV